MLPKKKKRKTKKQRIKKRKKEKKKKRERDVKSSRFIHLVMIYYEGKSQMNGLNKHMGILLYILGFFFFNQRIK